MGLLPQPPRERVAIGTAAVTAGVLLCDIADGSIAAFVAGSLIGAGLTLVVTNLLRLRGQDRASRSSRDYP